MTPMTRKRCAADPHVLAQRVRLAEELPLELRPEHGQRRAAPRVLRRQEPARPHFEPPDRRHRRRSRRRRRPRGRARRPRRAAVPNATGTTFSTPGTRRSASASSSVSLRRVAADRARDAGGRVLPGVDGEQVRAELRELARGCSTPRPLAERGQEDDRGDPDDDPEHGQRGAQPVGRNRAPGEAQERPRRLTLTSSRAPRPGRAAPPAAPAARRRRARPRARRRSPRRPPRRAPRPGSRVEAQEHGPAQREAQRQRRPAPPAVERIAASTRKTATTCRRVTPTALSSPISRVRSETETSITFMIPIPATVSEIAAMPPGPRSGSRGSG